MNDFYAYAYIDPRTDEPFYIGKGRGPRIDMHLISPARQKKTFMANKINKLRENGIEPVRRKLLEHLTESEAFFFESFFIKALGRRTSKTGPLTNLTDGGEGSSGREITPTLRRKLSEANKGRTRTEETRRRIRLANRKRWERPEEHRRASQSQQRRFSDPTERQRQRVRVKTAWQDPTRRQRMTDANRKRFTDPDERLHLSFRAKAAWADPEKRRKMVNGNDMKPPRNASGYKGVRVRGKSVMAELFHAGINYYLGSFKTLEAAARTYDAVARVAHNGECYVNFPHEEEWWDRLTQE